MKHILKLMLIIFIACTMQDCTEDEVLRPEKVQFTCNFQSSNTKGRISSLPNGTTVRISIQTKSGQPVLTNHTINILSLGESHITDPLELKPGTYKIVEFLLVNGSQILYATPRQESALAGDVIHPLDFEFSVVKNAISNFEMEVVDVTSKVPGDFGYASFNIGIVNSFDISAFTEQNNQFNLTSADAYILQGADTIRTFKLSSTINRINFTGDQDKTYTLDVIKDGYSRYSRTFTPKSLPEELGNKPLKVFLNPAVTMFISSLNATFDLYIMGNPGEININWGDGTSGSYELDLYGKSHNYAVKGNYFVSITGDLSAITFFSAYYDIANTHRINLEHLPALIDMRCGYTTGPKILDLTHNTKLENLDLGAQKRLERVDLPTNHFIKDIIINGPNHLTIAAVDNIINNIYANTVNKNIMNGSFHLRKIFYDDLNSAILGPPSEASLIKLRALRDTYGWFITPLDF